jgi:hypothetical protein
LKEPASNFLCRSTQFSVVSRLSKNVAAIIEQSALS